MARMLLTAMMGATAALAASAGALHAQVCMWTEHAPAPAQYSTHAVLYDAGRQQVVSVELWRSSTTPMRIWAWDGTAWMLLDESGPPGRSGASAAYDSTRGHIVVFGGERWQNTPPIGTTYPTDTWVWDGQTWIQAATVGPPGRTSARMAHDDSRQRTVLFGGVRQGYHGDTWEWDGRSWTLATTTGPSPRATRCFAYDSVRARTMLFGGTNHQGRPADLWEWDGAAWVELAGNAPDVEGTWMVFDPARATMIVGRAIGSWWETSRHETWEFQIAGNAAQWQLRDPGTAPWGPGAFDIARSRAVLRSRGITMQYNGAGTTIAAYITEHPSLGHIALGQPLILSVEAAGALPLAYQWRRNGQPLSNGPNFSGVDTHTLTVHSWQWSHSGGYAVLVSNACATAVSETVPVPGHCYPNCDSASVPPLLNVDDFTCFIHEFAAAQTLAHEQQITHYANCDGSMQAPVLNVDDFTCFINAFAAGCP